MKERWERLSPQEVGRLPLKPDVWNKLVSMLQTHGINHWEGLGFTGLRKQLLQSSERPRLRRALRAINKWLYTRSPNAVHMADRVFAAARRAKMPMEFIKMLPDIYDVWQDLPETDTERHRWEMAAANTQSALRGMQPEKWNGAPNYSASRAGSSITERPGVGERPRILSPSPVTQASPVGMPTSMSAQARAGRDDRVAGSW